MATKSLSTFRFQPVQSDLICDRCQGADDIVFDDENITDFSIHDVLLLLPGHGIIYFANLEVAGWYIALMIADGLSLTSIEKCNKYCFLKYKFIIF